MKVILKQDVPSIGKSGQLKEVSDGYARNYLIPKGLAVPATQQALGEHQAQQAAEKRRQVKQADANRALADQMSQIELVFKVKVGEQHRLYGSITSTDIAEALSKKLGRPVDKHEITLEEPLKHLGTFKVSVHVGPKLSAQVSVTLEKE